MHPISEQIISKFSWLREFGFGKPLDRNLGYTIVVCWEKHDYIVRVSNEIGSQIPDVEVVDMRVSGELGDYGDDDFFYLGAYADDPRSETIRNAFNDMRDKNGVVSKKFRKKKDDAQELDGRLSNQADFLRVVLEADPEAKSG